MNEGTFQFALAFFCACMFIGTLAAVSIAYTLREIINWFTEGPQ